MAEKKRRRAGPKKSVKKSYTSASKNRSLASYSSKPIRNSSAPKTRKRATAKRGKLAKVETSTYTKTTAYYQTGTRGRTHKELKQDSKFKAKLPGKRLSASGNVYYERRANRSDTPGERKNFDERHRRR